MNKAPEPTVGRALAKISALRRGPAHTGTSPGGDSRAAILSFLEGCDEAVRIEDISSGVGLHGNTVRGHLDALLAAGRITRIRDRRTNRGRPHWLYAATSTASMRELSRALEAELDIATAPEVAQRAAAGWAQAFPTAEPAQSMDEAVDQAAEALTAFGFDAVRNPVGDQLTLRSCPYASMVEEQPVICDIHAALLSEVLSRSGQPITVERLDVWPRPGLCVAHLDRPDSAPAWSVSPESDATIGGTTPKGRMPSTAKTRKPRGERKQRGKLGRSKP